MQQDKQEGASCVPLKGSSLPLVLTFPDIVSEDALDGNGMAPGRLGGPCPQCMNAASGGQIESA